VCCVLLLLVVQVNIGLRVLTRPNPEKLPQLYRTLGQVSAPPGGGVQSGQPLAAGACVTLPAAQLGCAQARPGLCHNVCLTQQRAQQQTCVIEEVCD
jgi:hypothetical protein